MGDGRRDGGRNLEADVRHEAERLVAVEASPFVS